MNKTTITLLVLFIFIASAGSLFLYKQNLQKKEVKEGENNIVLPTPVKPGFDAKNATFIIDKERITLQGGVYEGPIFPGTSLRAVTRYFGNETVGDLNGDNLPDTVFLVTQEAGNSGVFYFAVSALQTKEGYQVSNTFLVGKDIAPQSIVIPVGAKEIQINYAKRKKGEPLSVSPSEGATLLLKVAYDGTLEGLMK